MAAISAASWLASVGLAAQVPPELRWGGDAEGGAPFVEADPADPTSVVGFEVDIAQLLALELGRVPRFIQVGFTTIDAAAARGDFDIALSGVEDTPARRARLAVTIPYYEFREILTVREMDRDRFRSLEDLRGRRVATLGATLAYDVLVQAQASTGVMPVTYEDDVHPYSDLAIGRVDAVVLDYVLADRGVRRNKGLVNQTADLGVGYYVGVLAPGQADLRDRINGILREAMQDGRLEAIFRRWNMWNEDQPRLYARVLGSDSTEMVPVVAGGSVPGVMEATRRYHAHALMRGDGAGGRNRCLDCEWPGVRQPATAGCVNRLRGSHTGDAASPAALRSVLRVGCGRPAPGVCGGSDWTRRQLRGV
jgi:polar amino acid transport system substrate-binding protein